MKEWENPVVESITVRYDQTLKWILARRMVALGRLSSCSRIDGLSQLRRGDWLGVSAAPR